MLNNWIKNLGDTFSNAMSSSKGSGNSKRQRPAVNKQFAEERCSLQPQLPSSLRLLPNTPRNVTLPSQKKITYTNVFGSAYNYQQFEEPEVPFEFIDLEIQNPQNPEDNIASFPLYNDEDLPLLDPSTKLGREISKSIVAADFDDDCATDDDMKANACRLLEKELRKGVEVYLIAKQKGQKLF